MKLTGFFAPSVLRQLPSLDLLHTPGTPVFVVVIAATSRLRILN